MKSLLARLASATFLTIGLAAAAGAQPPAKLPAVGSVAPDFTLKTLDGKTSHTLSALKGKVVYIDFWASWCAPCRRSFPEVIALHEEYKGRGFEVLAVSLDRSVQPALQFMAKQEASFPSLFDEGAQVARRYGVMSIPSSIIVGPDGKVAYSATGFDPKGLPALKTLIEQQLEKAIAMRAERK